MASDTIYALVSFTMEEHATTRMIPIDLSKKKDGWHFQVSLVDQLGEWAHDWYEGLGDKPDLIELEVLSAFMCWDARWGAEPQETDLLAIHETYAMQQVIGSAERGSLDMIKIVYGVRPEKS